jgi:hypothetical protein
MYHNVSRVVKLFSHRGKPQIRPSHCYRGLGGCELAGAGTGVGRSGFSHHSVACLSDHRTNWVWTENWGRRVASTCLTRQIALFSLGCCCLFHYPDSCPSHALRFSVVLRCAGRMHQTSALRVCQKAFHGLLRICVVSPLDFSLRLPVALRVSAPELYLRPSRRLRRLDPGGLEPWSHQRPTMIVE